MEQKSFEIVGTELIKYRGSDTVVHIPEGVVSIADSAFYFCDKIEEVVFPKSLERIGRSAFTDCHALRNVVFPDGLSVIGDAAFESCHSLLEIDLPPQIQYLGNMAFAKCNSLRRASLPDGVEVLKHGLFLGAVSLQYVKLPAQLSRMEDSVFYYCKSLEEIEVPERVADIYPTAFYGCESLRRGYIPGIDLSRYRMEEQVMFAVLYLTDRIRYSLYSRQMYEAFIWDFKEKICEKILESSNYEALDGLLKLDYLNREEFGQWIEQARRCQNVEFAARLIKEKTARFGQDQDSMWEI